MAGPGTDGGRRSRAARLSTLAGVWLAGLAAGFYAVLAATARYGCGAGDHGFACQGSGTAVGILVVLAVVAVVTVVTVLTHGREPRHVVRLGAMGAVGLLLCVVAAWLLLDTV